MIEVLAALMLTATFVSVVLPFAVHLLSRWSTGERDVNSADTWMQAIERLSDDAAQAIPIMVKNPGQPDGVGFTAAAASVKLVRPGLGEAAKLNLEIVTYSVRSTPRGDMLVRHARPYRAADFNDEPGEEPQSTILDGPFRLRFAVVGAKGRIDEHGNDVKSMPLRVELSVRGLTRDWTPPSPIVLPIAARRKAKQPPPAVQPDPL